jgi:D-alanyl-D-alanine carboxypeptidase (penicillin-binding protein 5/6)
MDELVHPSGRVTGLVNTNRLIRYYDGCDGGKTGSTNEAGCCLCATAKRNGMRLISVVIGAPNSQTRFNECSKLFNYGFANFENQSLLDIEKVATSLPVGKGKIASADIFASENFSVTTKKGGENGYNVDLILPEIINAPAKSGQSIGKAIVSKDGNVIKEIDLILKNDIEGLSLFDCFKKVANEW